MSEGFGMESPRGHIHSQHRRPARYLVVIDSAGSTIARLYLDTRELVAEFDAGSEEVAVMAKGLVPATGATGTEWDRRWKGTAALNAAPPRSTCSTSEARASCAARAARQTRSMTIAMPWPTPMHIVHSA